jgi:hypothetical protein
MKTRCSWGPPAFTVRSVGAHPVPCGILTCLQAARRLEGLLTDHETFHRNTQEAQEAMEYVEQCLAQRRAEREQREQQQQQEAVTGSAPQPP